MSLFNLAFARQQGGQFVLRIEDTDRARYVADSEQQVFDTLRWLGLDWDEGPDKGGPYAPYRQSERLGDLPACTSTGCSPTATPTTAGARPSGSRRCARSSRRPSCRPATTACASARRARSARPLPGFSEQPVVRMLIPDDAPLVFDDVIRGEVKAPRPDDQVIVKADGFPTYHLANVVDDHEMGITHVVRGEEWISSTPKHVLLYDWLGWERPAFAHMPLLRNTDKSKISKRKNPAARLTVVPGAGLPARGAAQLPRADGLLAARRRGDLHLRRHGPRLRLGAGSTPSGRCSTSTSSTGSTATTSASCRSTTWPAGSPITWYAGGCCRPSRPPSSATLVLAATPLVNERMQVLSEAEGMLGFLLVDDADFARRPRRRGEGRSPADARPVLDAAVAALSDLAIWATEDIEAALRAALVEGLGLKPKVAFGAGAGRRHGRRVSPPLFESMELLGRDRSLARLRSAAAMVAG